VPIQKFTEFHNPKYKKNKYTEFSYRDGFVFAKGVQEEKCRSAGRNCPKQYTQYIMLY